MVSKFDVLEACLALVLTGQREHFIGHVEALRVATGGGSCCAARPRHWMCCFPLNV
jgi:hypothetical protein